MTLHPPAHALPLPFPTTSNKTHRRGNPPSLMADSALAPDSRFGEVDGGTDIYPDERGMWHVCDEGEMTVSIFMYVCIYVCLIYCIYVYVCNSGDVTHTYTSTHSPNPTPTQHFFKMRHQVQAGPMVHTVPCVGFVVTEKDRPGTTLCIHVKFVCWYIQVCVLVYT